MNGGNVTTADGATIVNICPEDGTPDVLSFINSGNSTAGYTYILTDVNNNILSTIPTGTLDFDNINVPAEVRIWGVAYSGLLSVSAGLSRKRYLATAVLICPTTSYPLFASNP
ncbi:MAG: hypothetical protein R2795_25310 [Saprospiraceae bacterium]